MAWEWKRTLTAFHSAKQFFRSILQYGKGQNLNCLTSTFFLDFIKFNLMKLNEFNEFKEMRRDCNLKKKITVR